MTAPRTWRELSLDLAVLLAASPGLDPDAAILSREHFRHPAARTYGCEMEAARQHLAAALDAARELVRPRHAPVKEHYR